MRDDPRRYDGVVEVVDEIVEQRAVELRQDAPNVEASCQ
jgi:hypothetical protein